MSTPWRLVLLLTLLLAACAPTQRGHTLRNPLALSRGAAVEAVPGSELFVRLSYGWDEVGLREAELANEFWIPGGVNRETADVSDRLSLREVRVPGGWTLELAEARAARSYETRYGEPTGTVERVLDVTFRVMVPAGAELGTTVLRGELASRRGSPRPLEIPVRVRMPSLE